MFNKIILIGNLTKDPELKYLSSGTAVCDFRIAVNSRYKKGNESKDDVLFIGVVTFGKQAESNKQYLAKGKTVLVEGRLREQTWEKDGQKHSKVEVLANTVRFLSKKETSGEGDGLPLEEESKPSDSDEPTDLEPF